MPETIMRMFESQFAESVTPPANDAAMTLARWMAGKLDILSGDDTELLVAVGGALVLAGSEDRWRADCSPPLARRACRTIVTGPGATAPTAP